MRELSHSLQVVATSAAIAAFIVFVMDFFFLSEFVQSGNYQCVDRFDQNCALARHLGDWWPLWDLLAIVLITIAIWALLRLADPGKHE